MVDIERTATIGGRSLIADMGHFFSGMRTVVPWVGVSLLPYRFAARQANLPGIDGGRAPRRQLFSQRLHSYCFCSNPRNLVPW